MKTLKIGITAKLFLAIVSTSLVAVLLMTITVRHRFQHDFLQYVNETEVQKLNVMAAELAAQYGQRQDWGVYRGHPRAWLAFVRQHSGMPRHGMMMHGHSMGVEDSRQDDMPTGPLLPNRLTLLDADKAYVAGHRDRSPEATLVPVVAGEKTVGWLSLDPAPHLTALTDISFQQSQIRSGMVIGSAAVLLAAVVAVFMARQFRFPIRRLVDATRRLSAGDFAVRMEQTSRDELGQLQRDFNRLAKALEENEKARRRWQADISHELRTPTAVLRGEIEALQDGVREVNADTLQSLHTEVLHIHHLIEDLYQLSMSDIGALNYKMELIDVTVVIEEVMASHQEQIEQLQLSIRMDLDSCRTQRLFADGDRLHQLFGNLLQNTLRYTDAGGELEIRCETQEDALVLHWRDSAPGVSDENLGRLFESLYRAEDSRNRQSGGAGLGLAICKNIVDAHEGRIIARHSPTGGIWMEIFFPVHTELT